MSGYELNLYWYLIYSYYYCDRVGIASFISLLIQKVGADIKPFTSMLLKLLFPVVKEEKSGSVKRYFASACATVLKHADPSQAQKLIEETAALHAGDRNAQISCAILLKAYCSMASDIMSGYHAIIVPVIFISRLEPKLCFLIAIFVCDHIFYALKQKKIIFSGPKVILTVTKKF